MKILPADFDGQSIRRVYDEAADLGGQPVGDEISPTDLHSLNR